MNPSESNSDSTRNRRLRPFRMLFAFVSGMALIVGAACQPLQPGDDTIPPPPPRPAAGTPPAEAPDAAVATPLPDRDTSLIIRPGPPRRVALILPLSGRREAAGAAVRDGFIAGWFASGAARPELITFDEASMSAADAYRLALEAGANAVVGPLMKEAVDALAPLSGAVPVLALNVLGDGIAGPAGFWQFGLSPEDEAREVARRALSLGQRRAVALAADSDWGRRVLKAFRDEYIAGGGELRDFGFYMQAGAGLAPLVRDLMGLSEQDLRARRNARPNPDEEATSVPRRRQDIELIFIAGNMAAGRQIVPLLRFYEAGDLPLYATSAIWEDGSGAQDDLNGVRFPDAAFVVDPDGRGRATRAVLARHWPRSSAGASRLYAFGYDAALLLPWVGRTGDAPPVDGLTGRLEVGHDGIVQRELSWAQIRRGRPEPLRDEFPAAPGLASPEPSAPELPAL